MTLQAKADSPIGSTVPFSRQWAKCREVDGHAESDARRVSHETENLKQKYLLEAHSVGIRKCT